MEIVEGRYKIQAGDVDYFTPVIPDENVIHNFGLPAEQQKWNRELFLVPKDYAAFTSDEKVDWIVSDINRRLHGIWIFINGQPTYITGDHFFYLQWWWIGSSTHDGYPEYRSADRIEHYFYDYCEKDPNCYGEVFMTGKRKGKTERSLSRLYNKTSIFEDKSSIMQSLTGKEAQKNLFFRVIRSWRKMPDAIKPVDDGSTSPVSTLRFFEPGKKSTKRRVIAKKAINSWIEFKPTVASAIQGQKPFRVYLDEAPSIEEMNIEEWFTTTKRQCQLGKIVNGKIIMAATVEELNKKGFQDFVNLWNDSDFNERDQNGQTRSGLYRFFDPAYLGYEGCVDEFGNDNVLESGEYEGKVWLQNMFDAAAPDKRVKLKRQYPFNAQDAFDSVVSDIWEDDCKEILKHVRIQVLNEQPPMLYSIPFDSGGSVMWGESSREKPGVCKVFEQAQPGVKYRAGFDGAASDLQTGDVRGSKVAMVILKGFAGMDKVNYTPVMTYSLRPEKMEHAYQTIFLASRHYGQYGEFGLLGETNAGQGSPVVAFFNNHGGANLLMKKPKNLGMSYNETTEKWWIYRNAEVRKTQEYLANIFIRRYGMNLKHIDLITDLINMGKVNTDEGMAFLMAVLAFGDFEKIEQHRHKFVRPKMRRVLQKQPDGRVEYIWLTQEQPNQNPTFNK